MPIRTGEKVLIHTSAVQIVRTVVHRLMLTIHTFRGLMLRAAQGCPHFSRHMRTPQQFNARGAELCIAMQVRLKIRVPRLIDNEFGFFALQSTHG